MAPTTSSGFKLRYERETWDLTDYKDRPCNSSNKTKVQTLPLPNDNNSNKFIFKTPPPAWERKNLGKKTHRSREFEREKKRKIKSMKNLVLIHSVWRCASENGRIFLCSSTMRRYSRWKDHVRSTKFRENDSRIALVLMISGFSSSRGAYRNAQSRGTDALMFHCWIITPLFICV